LLTTLTYGTSVATKEKSGGSQRHKQKLKSPIFHLKEYYIK
jgi:hypothetical protein